MMFSFAARFWRGEEASEGFVEEWSVLFLFHQACSQSFSQQVAFDTDRGYSLHRVHAFTHRDAQARGAQVIDET
jgi:hypothetical protein